MKSWKKEKGMLEENVILILWCKNEEHPSSPVWNGGGEKAEGRGRCMLEPSNGKVFI